jgi:hypothetical protein
MVFGMHIQTLERATLHRERCVSLSQTTEPSIPKKGLGLSGKLEERPLLTQHSWYHPRKTTPRTYSRQWVSIFSYTADNT